MTAADRHYSSQRIVCACQPGRSAEQMGSLPVISRLIISVTVYQGREIIVAGNSVASDAHKHLYLIVKHLNSSSQSVSLKIHFQKRLQVV